jgi:hypothetical protein
MEFGGAVDAGRFQQFVRHARDELPKEIDAERVGEIRKDDAGRAGVQALSSPILKPRPVSLIPKRKLRA